MREEEEGGQRQRQRSWEANVGEESILGMCCAAGVLQCSTRVAHSRVQRSRVNTQLHRQRIHRTLPKRFSAEPPKIPSS